eukprot:CAMPEP_0195536960 /NCGR_PEP_ID=MMETSP0794_2-20130614/47044_1 /TAXON_ID=515487 /ORGANISM="Stephanopyxis turris, Strain CCMP 815" /LENGTH=47 /DNA_ID= /DNA_START= /DNA_END= /DNA_ORIENTATION=
MTPWGWNQTGHQSDQVVVHVPRVSQCGGTRRHDGSHYAVQLIYRGIV